MVLWDNINYNQHEELKVSPNFHDTSQVSTFSSNFGPVFCAKAKNGELLPLVNESYVKTAPRGSIDQLVHSFMRMIYEFSQADEDMKFFMAKWDIKDSFWRLNCALGEEWNFSYVLPQAEGEQVSLVVPNPLHMRWIKSPPYFCVASETEIDVAQQYVKTPVGTFLNHKFAKHSSQGEEFESLPDTGSENLHYVIECFVDDYISLDIPTSQEKLRYVANAVMKDIHDFFPAYAGDEDDSISLKKLKNRRHNGT